MAVYRREQGIYHLAEVYNAGPENILDSKVTLDWENYQGQQSIEVHKFIDDDADPLWATPHDCSILQRETKILIVDFPTKEVKGLVKVKVTGKTHLSRREIDARFEI